MRFIRSLAVSLGSPGCCTPAPSEWSHLCLSGRSWGVQQPQYQVLPQRVVEAQQVTRLDQGHTAKQGLEPDGPAFPGRCAWARGHPSTPTCPGLMSRKLGGPGPQSPVQGLAWSEWEAFPPSVFKRK